MTKSKHTKRTSSPTAYNLVSPQITTTSQPISTTPIPSILSEAYEKCHNNLRLCFGIKDSKESNCLDNNDCTLLFSSVPKGEGNIEVELIWDRGSSSSNNWAAVALSDDGAMGEDSVTECILKSNGKMVLRSGWNPSGREATVNVIDNSTVPLSTSFLNGIVYCKWHRSASTVIEGHNFDIKNNSYYLLLAYGPLDSGILTANY